MRLVYRGREQADCFSSIVMNPAQSRHRWDHCRRCGPHISLGQRPLRGQPQHGLEGPLRIPRQDEGEMNREPLG